MDFVGFMAGLGNVAEISTNVMKWINDNLLSRVGGLGGTLVSIVNFIKNLFQGDGFGVKIIDFFKNLFS